MRTSASSTLSSKSFAINQFYNILKFPSANYSIFTEEISYRVRKLMSNNVSGNSYIAYLCLRPLYAQRNYSAIDSLGLCGIAASFGRGEREASAFGEVTQK